MFSVLTEINWLAVLASTVVFAVLGGLYFSVVIANPYKIALGNQTKELPKPGPIFIVGPLTSSLVVVITSAVLLKALPVDSLGNGIALGLIAGTSGTWSPTPSTSINLHSPDQSCVV